MKTDKKPSVRNNKGLQKLTESEEKINSVLTLEKITLEDLSSFSKEEKNQFLKIMTERLNTLKGDELERFCNQLEDIMHPRVKNELWENNHINIMWGITHLIKEHGRMPSKSEIAYKTGISRQTIYKHLKDYKNNPYYTEFQQQFNIMSSKVMTTVFQYAINGDMRAAKLYLETIGALKNTSSGYNNGNINNNTLIQNQNNFIQIGAAILNQDIIKQMSPEQVNTIEGILKTIEVKEIEKEN